MGSCPGRSDLRPTIRPRGRTHPLRTDDGEVLVEGAQQTAPSEQQRAAVDAPDLRSAGDLLRIPDQGEDRDMDAELRQGGGGAAFGRHDLVRSITDVHRSEQGIMPTLVRCMRIVSPPQRTASRWTYGRSSAGVAAASFTLASRRVVLFIRLMRWPRRAGMSDMASSLAVM